MQHTLYTRFQVAIGSSVIDTGILAVSKKGVASATSPPMNRHRGPPNPYHKSWGPAVLKALCRLLWASKSPSASRSDKRACHWSKLISNETGIKSQNLTAETTLPPKNKTKSLILFFKGYFTYSNRDLFLLASESSYIRDIWLAKTIKGFW